MDCNMQTLYIYMQTLDLSVNINSNFQSQRSVPRVDFCVCFSFLILFVSVKAEAELLEEQHTSEGSVDLEATSLVPYQYTEIIFLLKLIRLHWKLVEQPHTGGIISTPAQPSYLGD